MVSSLRTLQARTRFRSCSRIGIATLSPHSSISDLARLDQIDWGIAAATGISAITRTTHQKRSAIRQRPYPQASAHRAPWRVLVCYNDDVLKSLNAALAKRNQTMKVVEGAQLVLLMIDFARGNLLEAKVEALVNTVNTVGVMGKGVPLMFKEAYPENFKAYATRRPARGRKSRSVICSSLNVS